MRTDRPSPSTLFLDHSEARILQRVQELLHLAERAYHSLPGELRDRIARASQGQDSLTDHIRRSEQACDGLAHNCLVRCVPAAVQLV